MRPETSADPTSLPQEVAAFLSSGPKPLLLAGALIVPDHGRTFETLDPATGQVLCTVSEASETDVDAAVAAAREALSGDWGRTSPSARARILWRLADLVDEHRHQLAVLESLDTGKPLAIAERYEIPMASETLRYFAGWATKLEGSAIPPAFPYPSPQHISTVRRPVGVVGAITPWNAPLMMQVWKLAPALACGNAVIHKPAEETPLTALRLAELTVEAGFPDGAVSVLPGFGEVTGAALVRHPQVDKIAFTGSTEVGRSIVQAAADSMKRVSLELGGKSPYIVFADAAEQDLDAAAKAAALAIYTNSGQVCAAGSRLLVQRSVHGEVVERVASYAEGLQLGPGLERGTRMGPVISERQLSRVLGFVEQGQQEGARLVTGGAPATEEELRSGFFMRPTVFDDVTPGTTLWSEEIFGPVVGVTPFATAEEAVDLANDTRYGLAAGIATRDLALAQSLAPRLRAGTVWINCYNLYDPAAPWGGFGQSGWGRENGTAAIDLFTELQTVWLSL